MSASSAGGRIRILPILLLFPLLLGLGIIVFFFATSPASASIAIFGPTVTATQETLWGYADVPKPTRFVSATPAPTILPVDTAISPVMETPASVVMEVIDDSAPESNWQQEIPLGVPSNGGGK